MPHTLLAADMDGTLLRDDYTISPRTKKAVQSWVASGRYFVPATGRPFCAMSHVSALFQDDMPFIVYNGAMAIMHKSQEVLFSITLSPTLVPEIYQLGTERKLPVILWCQEKLYSNYDNEYLHFYQEGSLAPTKLIESPSELSELAAQGVTKILWMDEPARVLSHQSEMQAHFGARVNCHASRPDLFEFVDPAASKAIALEKIGTKLGVPRQEMAAAGDSYNDLSMLEYVGFSIAMANSPEDIKKKCSYTSLSNNEDGVAAWIEQILNAKI